MERLEEPKMFAQLNHVAIVSENYTRLGLFYRALFGLTAKANPKLEALALSISDGYVGMNVNPRVAGRQSGFWETSVYYIYLF